MDFGGECECECECGLQQWYIIWQYIVCVRVYDVLSLFFLFNCLRRWRVRCYVIYDCDYIDIFFDFLFLAFADTAICYIYMAVFFVLCCVVCVC